MPRKIRPGMLSAALSLLLLLTACAGRDSLPDVTLQNNDPVEQLNSLERDIVAAREQQLDVLAPNSFARADELYREAAKMLAREDNIADILLKITSARVELQRAEQAGQISHTVLANVIKVRTMALKAGAGGLGEDFNEAEEGFLKLTRAIENDDLGWAQRHKGKIFDAFDQLELRAIKDKYLSDARILLEKAEGRKAAKIAPLTLVEAQDSLKEADDFISANRYRTVEIRKKAAEAIFQVRRLEIIMQESERLKKLDPELIARQMENQLHATAGKLGAPDLRDQRLFEQLESILATIDAWESASQQLNEEVISLQGVIQKLEAEKATLEGVTREEREARERLAEERRTQQLYTEIQSLFQPEEAEIYKQGNLLIIRLKGITYSVGSALVGPENYPLLAKVRRAIQRFGQPETVVEGHTDSTGSEKKNLELSQSRADAVRSYLVANETLPPEKITAVGFGSQRPLASNATAAGRAQNRRIDLIIKPLGSGEPL